MTYIYFLVTDTCQEDMDLSNDDYVENTDEMEVEEDNKCIKMEINMDDDLYQSPPQSPPGQKPLSPEDALFIKYLSLIYFLRLKTKNLTQEAIYRSQRLLIKKLHADGISLQAWEEYFWSYKFSTMDIRKKTRSYGPFDAFTTLKRIIKRSKSWSKDWKARGGHQKGYQES